MNTPIAIARNNSQRKEECPICGASFLCDEGPWLFRILPWAPICRECAAAADSELYDVFVHGMVEANPTIHEVRAIIESEEKDKLKDSSKN